MIMRHSNTRMFCLHIFRSMSLFIHIFFCIFFFVSLNRLLLYSNCEWTSVFSFSTNTFTVMAKKVNNIGGKSFGFVTMYLPCIERDHMYAIHPPCVSEWVVHGLVVVVFFFRFHVGTIINVPILEEAQLTFLLSRRHVEKVVCAWSFNSKFVVILKLGTVFNGVNRTNGSKQ